MKLVTETVTTDVRDVNIRQLTKHQRGTIDSVVTMFKHIDDLNEVVVILDFVCSF